MSTEKKKYNYIKGSAKQVTFSPDNYLINVDLLLSDLQKLKVNEAGYVKITLSKYKEVDKYGNTHSIYENTFVPDKSKTKSDKFGPFETPKVSSNGELKKRPTDDLPF